LVTKSATGLRADRQQSGDRVVIRYSEQLSHARLLGHRGGGEHAAEALVARGQQDVPCERVHRGAGDQADAVQVLVEGRDDVEVDAHHQHHLGVAQRRLARNFHGVDRLGVDSARPQRVPRPLPVAQLSDIALGSGDRAVDEILACLRVPDDDDVVALPVATARREPRVVEDAFKDLVGQRVAGVLANRTRGAHDVVYLHAVHLDCGIVER
jgi:hypothetical protein